MLGWSSTNISDCESSARSSVELEEIITHDFSFGGIVFDDNGIEQHTIRWRDPTSFVFTQSTTTNPNNAAIVRQRGKLAAFGSSVGRIRVENEMLSGWLSASANDRFFITSSHKLQINSKIPPIGVVSFEAIWGGEKDVFLNCAYDVTYEATYEPAHMTIWRFSSADVDRLPAPLHPSSRAFVINDNGVAIAYSCDPDIATIQSQYDNLPDLVKNKVVNLPDQITAFQVFHPNMKVASCGTIIQEKNDIGGGGHSFAFGIHASLSHGMSGAPVFLIDGDNSIGIAGQVDGAIDTKRSNSNSVQSIHHPDVAKFLRTYMTKL